MISIIRLMKVVISHHIVGSMIGRNRIELSHYSRSRRVMMMMVMIVIIHWRRRRWWRCRLILLRRLFATLSSELGKSFNC